MKKTLKTIHKLILNGNCTSKLLLAFKNASNIDDAKDEEKLVNKLHSYDEGKHKFNNNGMIDKNGWYE